jgi:hypothetical protein
MNQEGFEPRTQLYRNMTVADSLIHVLKPGTMPPDRFLHARL